MHEGQEIPIVSIVFRRPDLTKRALEAAAFAKPRQVFVIADGPRLNRG